MKIFISLICTSIIFYPFYSFTHFPDTLPFFSFLNISTFSVLFTLIPFTNILSTIRPFKCSSSMFLIILILPNIFSPIAPSKSSFTFHFVINPFTIIYSSISPDILTYSMNIILEEVSIICAFITPYEFSSTVFHPLFILALVFGTIRPLFYSKAMLFII